VGNSAGFSVAMAGAGPFIYQWQLSSNAGATYSNIVNGGIFSGALTATLLINTPPVTMNGYLFRVAVNGGSGCSGATSNAALLTVYTLPDIVITANPLIIGPGQTTTIFSTVTPNPAATYTWYYNGTVIPGATADTLLVDITGLGDYQLQVTDVNGCTDLSNIITIVHSFALTLFTYPNPSAGMFQVRYYSETNSALQRSLTVYNNRGERISTQTFTQTIPYQKIDIDIRAHGKGLYWIELRDADGKRLAINRAVVQ
ncbi:MAG: T9SS type A sorting domain-containing protein, partial [Ferruginibacter sp.]